MSKIRRSCCSHRWRCQWLSRNQKSWYRNIYGYYWYWCCKRCRWYDLDEWWLQLNRHWCRIRSKNFRQLEKSYLLYSYQSSCSNVTFCRFHYSPIPTSSYNCYCVVYFYWYRLDSCYCFCIWSWIIRYYDKTP